MNKAALPLDIPATIPAGAKAAYLKLRQRQADMTKVVVAASTACEMIDRGPTTVRKLIKSGELLVLFDGANQRVLVDSIFDFLIKRLLASYRDDGQLKRSHGFRGTQFQHMPKPAPAQPVDAA